MKFSEEPIKLHFTNLSNADPHISSHWLLGSCRVITVTDIFFLSPYTFDFKKCLFGASLAVFNTLITVPCRPLSGIRFSWPTEADSPIIFSAISALLDPSRTIVGWMLQSTEPIELLRSSLPCYLHILWHRAVTNNAS